MAEAIFKQYLANLQATLNQGAARKESFYEHIKTLLLQYTELTNKKKPDITILPKATEAGILTSECGTAKTILQDI